MVWPASAAAPQRTAARFVVVVKELSLPPPCRLVVEYSVDIQQHGAWSRRACYLCCAQRHTIAHRASYGPSVVWGPPTQENEGGTATYSTPRRAAMRELHEFSRGATTSAVAGVHGDVLGRLEALPIRLSAADAEQVAKHLGYGEAGGEEAATRSRPPVSLARWLRCSEPTGPVCEALQQRRGARSRSSSSVRRRWSL
jgi:hypothetical protein